MSFANPVAAFAPSRQFPTFNTASDREPHNLRPLSLSWGGISQTYLKNDQMFLAWILLMPSMIDVFMRARAMWSADHPD